MLENFIYAKQKSLFEEALNNGEVLDEAIVFIEDTKEIWNHGTYFDGNAGVRSIATGSTNGTISVNTNGTSAEVAVKGLGSAAYTESTAYASKSDLDSKITGSSNITGIDYVTQEAYDALVAAGAMESTVLYIIKEN